MAHVNNATYLDIMDEVLAGTRGHARRPDCLRFATRWNTSAGRRCPARWSPSAIGLTGTAWTFQSTAESDEAYPGSGPAAGGACAWRRLRGAEDVVVRGHGFVAQVGRIDATLLRHPAGRHLHPARLIPTATGEEADSASDSAVAEADRQESTGK